MSKLVKTKLCWNCEGAVAFNAENCPFCGVSVVPASLDGTPANFAPPYNMGTSQDAYIPRSPYAAQPEVQATDESIPTQTVEKGDETSFDDFKTAFWALVFLLSGAVFFLFGIVLVLFSTNGVFTLRWDATTWFFYSIVSVPLLILGWRCLSKLN